MLDIPFWTRVPRHQGSQITIHSIPIKYSLWLQWITFYWGLIQHYSTGPGGSAKGYIGQDAQPRGVKIKCHEPEPKFNVTVKRDKNCSSYLRSKVIKVIFITFTKYLVFLHIFCMCVFLRDSGRRGEGHSFFSSYLNQLHSAIILAIRQRVVGIHINNFHLLTLCENGDITLLFHCLLWESVQMQ